SPSRSSASAASPRPRTPPSSCWPAAPPSRSGPRRSSTPTRSARSSRACAATSTSRRRATDGAAGSLRRDQLLHQRLLQEQLVRRGADALPGLRVVLDALHDVPQRAIGGDRVAELQTGGHAVLAPAR